MTLKYEKARPTGLSREEIEHIAKITAEKLEFKPGGDIHNAIRKIGGRVQILSLGDNAYGELAIHRLIVEDKGFVIRAPENAGIFMERVLIAEGLGNYALHSKFGEFKIAAEAGISGPVLWEAMRFASGFLMPEKYFRKEWEKTGERVVSIKDIASIFVVSTDAAAMRARSLGLVGADTVIA